MSNNNLLHPKQSLFNLWLVVGIAAGFLTIVFFSITYLNETAFCSLECRMKNEVQIVIILLSFFGLFVGSVLYYVVSEKHKKEIISLNKNIEKKFQEKKVKKPIQKNKDTLNLTLDFLDSDSKKIIESLIQRNGQATQSILTIDTKLNKVKISRTLSKLEKKGLISKSPKGMTNKIILNKELTELFVKTKQE